MGQPVRIWQFHDYLAIFQIFTISSFQFKIVGKRPPERPYNMHFWNQRLQLD